MKKSLLASKLRMGTSRWLRRNFPHLAKTFGYTPIAQAELNPREKRGDRGVALLLATFSLAMILYVAMEVQYETQVEFSVNKQSIDRLKSYYAAKSGVELSLLRIKLYQKLKAQTGGQSLGPAGAMMDLIWSFPIQWPPMLPPEMNEVDQGAVNNVVKEATLDGAYNTTITDEGTKIDINDLDSNSKSIRESTRKLILQLFANETEANTPWSKRHPNLLPEDIVDNITDWLDSDMQAIKGGDERAKYSDLNTQTVQLPPNRQFRSVDELRLVAGMTDDIFDLLAPRITVYGAKAINPNTAPAELIQSLHSSITNEVVAEVLKRRQDIMNGGQFKDAADFWSFLDSKGARVPLEIQENTPISVASSMNFRIKSIGSYGNSQREIEVVTYDIPKVAAAVAEELKKDKEAEGGDDGGKAPTPDPAKPDPAAPKVTVPKGPPRIVSWTER